MGKFLKTCLIIGIICVGLGIAASSLGISAGGLSRLKEQLLEGEWSFDIALAPFFELDEQHFFEEDEELYANREHINKSFDATQLEGIYIKSSGIAVQFDRYKAQQTESGTAEVLVEAVKSGKFQAYVRDNVLYVIASGRSSNGVGAGTVTIGLPPQVYQTSHLKIEAEAAASTLNLGDMQAAEVDIDLNAGTVGWEALTANKLKIDMAAGAIQGENTIILDETELDMRAGAITLNGSLGTCTELDLSAGKLEMMLTDAFTDYNYDLSCAGGVIQVGDTSLEGVGKDHEIDHGAWKNLNIQCSAGTVNINFER